jgi:pyrroloquinoline quinone biosynthesis protein B
MNPLNTLALPPDHVSAVVLGTAQDAGLPHVGCRCPRCRRALNDPRDQLFAACLAVVDRRTDPAGVWLLDATPDIRWQLAALHEALGPHPLRPNGLRQPDGIFLTHAHMGHVGGLPQLGPEGAAVRDLPVHASPSLAAHLHEMPLWAPMMQGVALRPLWPSEPVPLGDALSLTPLPVPHRDETHSGTYAFVIRGPNRSLLYVPDIDSWEEWPGAAATLAGIDIALVDATFYSDDELGTRRVSHPPVTHTLDLFAAHAAKLMLTHLNHTNPVLDENGPERAAVRAAGASVASFGQHWAL